MFLCVFLSLIYERDYVDKYNTIVPYSCITMANSCGSQCCLRAQEKEHQMQYMLIVHVI